MKRTKNKLNQEYIPKKETKKYNEISKKTCSRRKLD